MTHGSKQSGSEQSQENSGEQLAPQKVTGKRKNYLSKDLSSILAGIAAIVTSLATALALLTNPSSIRPNSSIPVDQSLEELEEVRGQVQDITQEIDVLKAQIEAFSQVPEASAAAAQLERINSVVTKLESKQSNLEKVILDDPVKALEMPLLREELESTQDNQAQSFLALKQNIDQVYDLNKWLLGAMAISIITLAISNFLKEEAKAD